MQFGSDFELPSPRPMLTSTPRRPASRAAYGPIRRPVSEFFLRSFSKSLPLSHDLDVASLTDHEPSWILHTDWAGILRFSFVWRLYSSDRPYVSLQLGTRLSFMYEKVTTGHVALYNPRSVTVKPNIGSGRFLELITADFFRLYMCWRSG